MVWIKFTTIFKTLIITSCMLILFTSCSSKSFKVTFIDYNGTVLKEEQVRYDQSATAPANPIREGYDFSGSDKPYTNVTNNLEVRATYTIKTFTVTWKNHDGSVLETDKNVAWGSTPEYNGTTPTKAATTEYSYLFTGWSPLVSKVTGDVEYICTI